MMAVLWVTFAALVTVMGSICVSSRHHHVCAEERETHCTPCAEMYYFDSDRQTCEVRHLSSEYGIIGRVTSEDQDPLHQRKHAKTAKPTSWNFTLFRDTQFIKQLNDGNLDTSTILIRVPEQQYQDRGGSSISCYTIMTWFMLCIVAVDRYLFRSEPKADALGHDRLWRWMNDGQKDNGSSGKYPWDPPLAALSQLSKGGSFRITSFSHETCLVCNTNYINNTDAVQDFRNSRPCHIVVSVEHSDHKQVYALDGNPCRSPMWRKLPGEAVKNNQPLMRHLLKTGILREDDAFMLDDESEFQDWLSNDVPEENTKVNSAPEDQPGTPFLVQNSHKAERSRGNNECDADTLSSELNPLSKDECGVGESKKVWTQSLLGTRLTARCPSTNLPSTNTIVRDKELMARQARINRAVDADMMQYTLKRRLELTLGGSVNAHSLEYAITVVSGDLRWIVSLWLIFRDASPEWLPLPVHFVENCILAYYQIRVRLRLHMTRSRSLQPIMTRS